VCQTGNENCRSVAEFLVHSASKPFFEILSQWINRGVIVDHGRDFYVEDNEVIERSDLPLEYSDDYWERRYSIRAEMIPSFLHQHSDMILRTGNVNSTFMSVLIL
jgi:gamma-tubulin complex component 2